MYVRQVPRNLPPLARYADLLLDGRLSDFLLERRSEGDSFDTIAKKLYADTDRQVDVSGPTVQGWFERMHPAKAAM
jgi:hypothetical protein